VPVKIKRNGVTYRLNIKRFIDRKTGLITIPSKFKNFTQLELLEYLINNNPSIECKEKVKSRDGEKAERISNILSKSDFDYFHEVDMLKHKRRIRKQRNHSKWLEFDFDLFPFEKHLSEIRKMKIRLRKHLEEDNPHNKNNN